MSPEALRVLSVTTTGARRVITVVQQNDGTPPMRPGAPVTVTWAAAHGFALDASEDAHAGQETVLPADDELATTP